MLTLPKRRFSGDFNDNLAERLRQLSEEFANESVTDPYIATASFLLIISRILQEYDDGNTQMLEDFKECLTQFVDDHVDQKEAEIAVDEARRLDDLLGGLNLDSS